ncbi:unnamed protein product [Dovyalis caffra]|uniref:NYN domain-containing protein n=1 Tax=Dovyalis caffra TaxID=77055 RepID=A0AAV1RVZ9_9ROSI|nr:unnamed protein product [Dovyalis caffra]
MGGEGGIGGGGAEEQYVTAKTSVWWDIENCNVPRGCDPHAIAQNISSALSKMDYRGPVSISAYGDTQGINSAAQQALSSTGIALHHVPAGVKDASDKKILVDMLFWAVDNPPPANYLLISGDRDFSNALHQLRMRRYNILLAQPQRASAPLVAAAKSVWLWASLLAGGRPLTEVESQQLERGGDSKAQIPVSDAIKQPVDVANQKSPSTARSGDSKQKGKNIQRSPSQTNVLEKTSTPLLPSPPPAMNVRPYGTSFSSAPYIIVPPWGNLNNSGRPFKSSPQRQNPELKHDPKKKPDIQNRKKSYGENSKGSCAGKGPEPSQNKKKPRSRNKKKSDGENSKGSCAGKGPELSQNLKKPDSQNKKKAESQNSKGSSASRGPEVKHDTKKPDSETKKKAESQNSKGSSASRGPEVKHDTKKPDSENKKKQVEEKKPDSENKKVARAKKGVSVKKSVAPRSIKHVSVTKQDKGKKNPPAKRGKVKQK